MFWLVLVVELTRLEDAQNLTTHTHVVGCLFWRGGGAPPPQHTHKGKEREMEKGVSRGEKISNKRKNKDMI